jgi:uncharacterized protein
MRALISGATGFIGRRLVTAIERPVVLARDPVRARRELGGVEAFAWDMLAGPPPSEALSGAEAVFHLAGEPVAEGRWNDDRKRRIHDSRTLGTANLVRAIETATPRPRVLVCASAIGYYGSRGDEILDETSSPGDDFLAHVCRDWEAAAAEVLQFGVRVVNVRIGIVLGRGGGALGKMLLPFKLGLGGRLASGQQWMSWIHVDDVVGLMLHAAQRDDVAGPINAVAPAPVTNREFTRALAGALHRPALFPAPAFALRLAVGEFADVLLGSQRVMPRVAQRSGYEFRYSELATALEAIVRGA